MANNPDLFAYVDLRIYDKTPDDIKNAAMATLAASMPEWEPHSTNVEVLLMEALAIEVAEAVFSINRLPQAMVEIFLGLFGIDRLPGVEPKTTVRFNVVDTAGYTIPQGTQVAMSVDGSSSQFIFTTDVEAAVQPGSYYVTIPVTGIERSAIVNGVSANTPLELLDAVMAVESVTTASIVTDGVDPESDIDYLTRGIQKFQRMSETLVIPSHFVTAALEQVTYVSRATVVDNYDPATGPDPGDNPGHVTVVVYGLGGLISEDNRAALLNLLSEGAAANLAVHVVDPVLQTVDVAATVKKYPQYTDEEVLANVTATLTEYMSPEVWPWSGTVRYNELVSVIDHCEGVNYVVDITDPAVDVVYGIDTLLVTLGTLDLTIT